MSLRSIRATRYCASQLLRQEPQQPRHEETRVAAGLVERIAQPIMPGTLHHAATGEKAGLLEGLEEGFGMRLAVDQVILGAVGKQHRCLVVRIGGVADRRGTEVELPVLRQSGAKEILDIVVERARDPITLPHGS